MVAQTYTGVLIGLGVSEVSLQRINQVDAPQRTLGTVRHLAGGGRRSVTSPNEELIVTVTAEEVPYSSVESLRSWQGRVVRCRFGFRDPLYCLLAQVQEATTPMSQQHSRDRVAALVLTLIATTATAADVA